jgi:hypothetical protein
VYVEQDIEMVFVPQTMKTAIEHDIKLPKKLIEYLMERRSNPQKDYVKGHQGTRFHIKATLWVYLYIRFNFIGF